MDKTIRRITDFKSQREETYRYWQSRPISEGIETLTDVVRTAYRAKGIDVDSLTSDKTIHRLELTDWKAVA
jgi:hypothetical protein